MSDETQDTPVENVFIYQDAAGEWRWKAVARNGEQIAASGEGYKNMTHAREMASRLFPGTSLRQGSDDPTIGESMHAKGTITIGGAAFGAVTIDMETDDGTQYHFTGYYADAGIGVGVCDDAEGDFPGLSHIIGGCMLEVAAVPGGMGIAFNDLHGEIGQLGGVFKGAVVQAGFGGGSWRYENSAGRSLEKAEEEYVEEIEEGD